MIASTHTAGVLVTCKPAILTGRLPGRYGTLGQRARVPVWTVTRPDGNARSHVFHEPTKSRGLRRLHARDCLERLANGCDRVRVRRDGRYRRTYYRIAQEIRRLQREQFGEASFIELVFRHDPRGETKNDGCGDRQQHARTKPERPVEPVANRARASSQHRGEHRSGNTGARDEGKLAEHRRAGDREHLEYRRWAIVQRGPVREGEYHDVARRGYSSRRKRRLEPGRLRDLADHCGRECARETLENRCHASCPRVVRTGTSLTTGSRQPLPDSSA